MEKSESIAALAKALSKFQGEIENVTKGAENPFFKSKYASLDMIWDAVREALSKNGLALSQFPTEDNQLLSVLMHESGEWLSTTAKMTPVDSKPQSQGSAITYMRRYAMGGILGIASEEDDDGNAASTPKAKEKPKVAAKRPVESAFQVAEKFITNAASLEVLSKAEANVRQNPKFSESQKETLLLMIHDRKESLEEGESIV